MLLGPLARLMEYLDIIVHRRSRDVATPRYCGAIGELTVGNGETSENRIARLCTREYRTKVLPEEVAVAGRRSMAEEGLSAAIDKPWRPWEYSTQSCDVVSCLKVQPRTVGGGTWPAA